MSDVERYGQRDLAPRSPSSRVATALVQALYDLDQDVAVMMRTADVSMRIMERRAEAEIAQSRIDHRRR